MPSTSGVKFSVLDVVSTKLQPIDHPKCVRPPGATRRGTHAPAHASSTALHAWLGGDTRHMNTESDNSPGWRVSLVCRLRAELGL